MPSASCGFKEQTWQSDSLVVMFLRGCSEDWGHSPGFLCWTTQEIQPGPSDIRSYLHWYLGEPLSLPACSQECLRCLSKQPVCCFPAFFFLLKLSLSACRGKADTVCWLISTCFDSRMTIWLIIITVSPSRVKAASHLLEAVLKFLRWFRSCSFISISFGHFSSQA